MTTRVRFDRLQTQRLIMRRWQESDRAPFAELNADPETMRFFPSTLDRASSDALIEMIETRFDRHGFGFWALEVAATGTFIGFTGLNPLPDGVPGAGGVEVGWRLARHAWHHGYATEAARAALDVAFDHIGLPEIWSLTAVLNEPSQAVMRRLGLTETARFDHPRIPPGDPLRPQVAYHGYRPAATVTEGAGVPGRGTDQLFGMIRSSSWLMRVLATVREVDLPDAWVGAGTIRDLVWGQLYGPGFQPGQVHDVDVAFFDSDDLRRAGDERATRRLRKAWPQVPWEASNQAAVHTWYADEFGGDPVGPLLTITDAVATWPETATAVAVRLDRSDRLEVCAPLGLADLLDGVWRRNPRRVSLEVSLARLARHEPRRRWPGVTVVRPDG